MAEAASLAAIMTNVQSGLQTVLNARSDMIREVHDATTKRGLTKLNRFFLNAQLGEFTEEDFEKAKRYYAKIEAVAIMSQNQVMLTSLKEGLALLKTTLVVKNLMDKMNQMDKKPETDSSYLKTIQSEGLAIDVLNVHLGDAKTEDSETDQSSDDEDVLGSSIPLEDPSCPTTDGKLAKFKISQRTAVRGLTAIMPLLPLVAKNWPRSALWD